jgi:hypothetical protein
MSAAVELPSLNAASDRPATDGAPVWLALQMPSVASDGATTRRGAASRRLNQIVFATPPGRERVVAVALVGRQPLDDDRLPAFAAALLEDPDPPAWPHRTVPLDDATLERLRRAAARAGDDGILARVAAFEATLDAERLAVCPAERPLRQAAYDWLGLLAPVARRRMIDAVRVYPFLWTVFFTRAVPSTSAAAMALRACVADAEPLAPALAQALAAAPWQVRALQRAFAGGLLSTGDVGSAGELMTLVRALDRLPPEQVPATRPGWLYLARAAESTQHKGWLRCLAGVGLDRLASGREIPRAWRRFARMAGLRRAFSDLRDLYAYAADYGEPVWLPPAHATDLRAVVEAHDRWKAVIDPLGGSAAPAPAHLSGRWSPLLDAPVEVDGHVFHDLATVDALREDGFLMKHCIGSYAQLCEEKGSRIFSVRDAEGRRISTLQVHFLKGAWHVLQQRGKANTNPPASAQRAATAFAVRLNALEASRPRTSQPTPFTATSLAAASAPAPAPACSQTASALVPAA